MTFLSILVSLDCVELALSIEPDLEVPVRATLPVPLFVHLSTREESLRSV
jgi:hypothetical protein